MFTNCGDKRSTISHGTDENWMGTHTDPRGVRPHFTKTWQAQIDAALADEKAKA